MGRRGGGLAGGEEAEGHVEGFRNGRFEQGLTGVGKGEGGLAGQIGGQVVDVRRRGEAEAVLDPEDERWGWRRAKERGGAMLPGGSGRIRVSGP